MKKGFKGLLCFALVALLVFSSVSVFADTGEGEANEVAVEQNIDIVAEENDASDAGALKAPAAPEAASAVEEFAAEEQTEDVQADVAAAEEVQVDDADAEDVQTDDASAEDVASDEQTTDDVNEPGADENAQDVTEAADVTDAGDAQATDVTIDEDKNDVTSEDKIKEDKEEETSTEAETKKDDSKDKKKAPKKVEAKNSVTINTTAKVKYQDEAGNDLDMSGKDFKLKTSRTFYDSNTSYYSKKPDDDGNVVFDPIVITGNLYNSYTGYLKYEKDGYSYRIYSISVSQDYDYSASYEGQSSISYDKRSFSKSFAVVLTDEGDMYITDVPETYGDDIDISSLSTTSMDIDVGTFTNVETTKAPIIIVKYWEFRSPNEDVLYVNDWPSILGLSGSAKFEIKGLPDGTYETMYNSDDVNGKVVVENGVGEFEIKLQYGDGSGTYVGTWGPQFFSIVDVPVGTTYTVTEISDEVYSDGKKLEGVNWTISSESSFDEDGNRPFTTHTGYNNNGTQQQEYTYKIYHSAKGNESITSKVVYDPTTFSYDTASKYSSIYYGGNNRLEFHNVKYIDAEVNIKKEVVGKDDGTEYEIIIIPMEWIDTKTRFNSAMPFSLSGVNALDIGREDADELLDLDFYRTDMRYIYQLTVPDHGMNTYAYFESVHSQFEKANMLDSGFFALYYSSVAEKLVACVNENTNNFFAKEGEHFLESAKKLDELAKSKGYKNAGEYFLMNYWEQFEDGMSTEAIDKFIEEHQDCGVTKGDFIYMHMVGLLALFDGLQIESGEWIYNSTIDVDFSEYKEVEEYYEEVTEFIKTIHTIKNGDTIDYSEYLKYSKVNMIFIYEKDYTADNYRRTGVVTNWINPKDFTAEELLADGKVTLNNVIKNIKPVGYGTIKANKILEGADLQANQFTFELKDVSGNVLQTAKNDADGNVVFEEIEYLLSDAKEEQITYTISEVNDGKADITYDTHEETVNVTITDDGTENLVVDIEYDDDGAVFTNKYEEKKETVTTNNTPKKDENKETTVPKKVENKNEETTVAKKSDETTKKETTTAASGKVKSNTPSNGSSVQSASKSPKTGDETNVALYVILIVAAAGILSVLLIKRRRHE